MLGRNGPRGRITSFFRAIRRVARTPVGLYGAARAGSAIGGAARAAYSARRRVTPTAVGRSAPSWLKSFPQTGPLVTAAGGVSAHTWNLSMPVTKQAAQHERLGAPNIYTKQTAFEISAAPGEQNTQSLALTDLVVLGNIGQSSGLANARGPSRFCLESVQSETVMTNQSTAPLDIEIFDLVLKRDLPAVQNMTWNVGPATSFSVLGEPDRYWTAGIHAGTSTPDTSANQALVIGSSPYDSQMWKDMFQCVKKTNVILNQGSSHRIVTLQKHGKIVDQALFSLGNAAVSGSLRGLRGVTTYHMIRIKGMPCTIDFTVPAGDVTTSAGRLAVVNYARYKYTWLADSSASLVYSESLVSPAFPLGIVNVGSGQPEPQAFAPGTV